MLKFFLNKSKTQSSESQKNGEVTQAIQQTGHTAIQKKKTPQLDIEALLLWQNRIAKAAQDDTALLKLAHDAPSVDLKLAAIQAITEESALKKAMHDFRDHDKRLYRAAKNKWDAAQDKRIATEATQALIKTAQHLIQQDNLAVNHVVELERTWKATQQALVNPELSSELNQLTEQLAEKVRRQSETEQATSLWLTKIRNVQAEFKKKITEIAQGNASTTDLEPIKTQLHALLEQSPHKDAHVERAIELSTELIALESNLSERMNFLGALPEAGSTDDEQAHALKTQWRNLNTDFINKHPHLFEASERKFNAWLRSNDALNRQAAETQAQQQREQRSKENTQRRETLQQHIQNAEIALTEGHTAELTQLLASIDTLIHTSSTSPALNQRIDFLRRELLRLKDWQRWSGGKSREQLAKEANELMQLATSKVDLKAHAEAIQKLRLQWKTLDKLGGGSNQALWQQFDQALNQAYTPIAAQIEKRATARQENLAAREQIIAKLIEDKNRLLPSPVESNDTPNEIDWRSIIHTLEHARIQWKKLGPVEHALPKEALSGDTAVTTRYAAAIEALETPLMKIKNEALRQRRKIIQSATALGESDLLNIHLVDKIKQLQTQWQTAAKTLPLLRHEEHKLWTEFKTATDTLFKTRDTARAQQEAATQEQIKAREALIEKLTQALSLEITAEIRKVISETEKAWRDLLALPKPLESKLTSRLRDAKHKLQQHINQLDRHAIEARFSALEAAITLCQQRDALYQGTAELDIASVDNLQHRWEQNTHLPEQWKLALNSRFQSAKQPSSNSPALKLLNTLLTLELACDIDSPKEFSTERQQLKMLQLKQALERGDSIQLSMTDIERLVLEVAAQPTSDLLVSARLNKIIQSLKNRASPR